MCELPSRSEVQCLMSHTSEPSYISQEYNLSPGKPDDKDDSDVDALDNLLDLEKLGWIKKDDTPHDAYLHQVRLRRPCRHPVSAELWCVKTLAPHPPPHVFINCRSPETGGRRGREHRSDCKSGIVSPKERLPKKMSGAASSLKMALPCGAVKFKWFLPDVDVCTHRWSGSAFCSSRLVDVRHPGLQICL